MNLTDKLIIGRSYVLFLGERQVRGRLVRKDALMLDLIDDGGQARRIGRAEVAAVLEPQVRVVAPPARLVS